MSILHQYLQSQLQPDVSNHGSSKAAIRSEKSVRFPLSRSHSFRRSMLSVLMGSRLAGNAIKVGFQEVCIGKGGERHVRVANTGNER